LLLKPACYLNALYPKVEFLKITTSEKKNGFLLIETFGRLFNPQIVGHLDHLQAVIDRGIQEALLSDTSKFNLMIF
jgi:hypothetical protein